MIRNFNLTNGTQQSSSKESSWLQLALRLAVQTVAKIAQGWVFTGFLLLMLKTNYFDKDGYKTFIAQIPRDENFNVCANHFEKDCFQRDLKVRNFVCTYSAGSRDCGKGWRSGWPAKKILGFTWSKKAEITLETISFWQNISISIFKFSPFYQFFKIY